YYQQIGRAGRATRRADVVLLPGESDRAIWDYFGSLSFPDPADVRAALAALPTEGERPMSTAALETHVDLRRNRLELMLKVLDVEGAVRRVRGGWIATSNAWEYDAARYARVEAARVAEQEAMLDYEVSTQCRMAFLRACLDDPTPGEADQCGRCDNCGGVPAPVLPDASAAASAAAPLHRPGVEITPRKQWPTGLKGRRLQVAGRGPAGTRTAPPRPWRGGARFPARAAGAGAQGVGAASRSDRRDRFRHAPGVGAPPGRGGFRVARRAGARGDPAPSGRGGTDLAGRQFRPPAPRRRSPAGTAGRGRRRQVGPAPRRRHVLRLDPHPRRRPARRCRREPGASPYPRVGISGLVLGQVGDVVVVDPPVAAVQGFGGPAPVPLDHFGHDGDCGFLRGAPAQVEPDRAVQPVQVFFAHARLAEPFEPVAVGEP